MAAPTATRLTADEFLRCEESEGYELVHGVPEEIPMGGRSSWIAGRLLIRIGNFVEARSNGFVFPQDTAVKAWPDWPDHFRKPDGMFFSRERLAEPPDGTIEAVPEFVFEVVSPRDDAAKLEIKIKEYFRAGVRLVWVLYPETRTVYVYRPDGLAAWMGPEGTLTGEDVLPGFSVPVAEIFGGPA